MLHDLKDNLGIVCPATGRHSTSWWRRVQWLQFIEMMLNIYQLPDSVEPDSSYDRCSAVTVVSFEFVVAVARAEVSGTEASTVGQARSTAMQID